VTDGCRPGGPSTPAASGNERDGTGRAHRRGQANLPALAVALLVVTAATGVALAVDDGAFAAAEREPDERRAAVAVADRLVAADAAHARRANVLAAARLDDLTAERIETVAPVAEGRSFRVRLGDRTLVERGTAAGGTTVRRIVLVERRQAVAVPVRNATVTLPRRSPRATVELEPAAEVTTLLADGRVVLHNESGLVGRFTVALSRYETTTLSVRGTGTVNPSTARLIYYPAVTRKAELVVTVAD